MNSLVHCLNVTPAVRCLASRCPRVRRVDDENRDAGGSTSAWTTGALKQAGNEEGLGRIESQLSKAAAKLIPRRCHGSRERGQHGSHPASGAAVPSTQPILEWPV